MATPNYKEIETLLALKENFKHGYSMSGQRVASSLRDLADEYVVWSYRTVIARYNFANGEWWINENKYSVTTSKQQNIIKRVARQDGWQAPEKISLNA